MNSHLKVGHKYIVFLVTILMVFGVLAPSLKPVSAQVSAPDPVAIGQRAKMILQNATKFIKDEQDNIWEKLWKSASSVALHRTITSALNKIAFDTANYIGSGGQGQEPLFVKEDWGAYLLDIGDEAAGQFIETTVANMGQSSELRQDCQQEYEKCMRETGAQDDGGLALVHPACAKKMTDCISRNESIIRSTPAANVCAPSSINAKLRITLGLVDQVRPSGPNCTINDIKRNWTTDGILQASGLGGLDMSSDEYLRELADFFDPRANDLGIMATARADMLNIVSEKTSVGSTELVAKRGWLDVRNLAGMTNSAPGTPERELESARRAQENSLTTLTLDPLVDAANVFVNQLALTAFNNLLRNLGNTSQSSRAAARAAISNPLSDPGAYSGVSALTEATARLLKPNFTVRTDYDILSSLVICPDPKNPGPDNCVIDSQFMQAISEKKTVAEALANGYLHSEWQFTRDNLPSSYSLRNISILRKYRIVPVGWETVIQKIVSTTPPKKATMGDLVACFDRTDKYSTFSTEFDQRDQSWCEGMVDPNWVLKAPLNYCRQEGVGSQIINKNVMQGSGDIPSSLSITRAENYCADNQTCIKERSDGSCEVYGYCNEERRTWNFNSSACKPINNTCQAFTSATGEVVAYLQNTLDYGNCNIDNSGCRRYSLTGDYQTTTSRVAWNSAVSAYFNKKLKSCDSGDEGCNSLFRVKPTWGLNLVMNSSFNNDTVDDVSNGNRLNDWPLRNNTQGKIVDASAEPGDVEGKAIKLTTTSSAGGLYSDSQNSLLPLNFQTIPGQAYTISADVYLVGDTNDNVTLKAGSGNQQYTDSTNVSGSWQHLSVTWPAETAYNSPEFSVSGGNSEFDEGAIFYVRNLRFEMGNWEKDPSNYGDNNGSAINTIYQKLLPPYLEKACYVDAANSNYLLKADAPAACSKFAPKCNKDEAGCDLYSAVSSDFKVAAQVVSTDYCADVCVGYDAYIAHGSYFYSPISENLIPATANKCTAASAGCTEFTNLDEVSRGGEGREYYSALKQCVKPTAASCATFYSWEGTDSGYQLRSYNLKKGSDNLPVVTHDDSEQCNEDIYKLSIDNANYNPDCRQYYNASGQVAYHLASLTITCSENCHVYRMTDKNVDVSITSASQCVGEDKNWNAANNACRVCLNGGTWDNASGACIYQAIPGEGVTCSAKDNGCREYSGSKGANVLLAAADDFEDGLGKWESNCNDGISISNIANTNEGKSVRYNNQISCGVAIGSQEAGNDVTRQTIIERLLADDQLAAQLPVYGVAQQNKSYTIRFLARAATDTAVKIFFLNPDNTRRAAFNQGEPVVVKGGNEWGVYQVNLDNLNHSVGVNEILALTADNSFNFDDFTLSEITDRYYLIRNSSEIKPACYYDVLYNYKGAEYNLGCAQYTDRLNGRHNLHRFSNLCSSSAVGCEQMIDTSNSAKYGPSYWQDGLVVESCAANDPTCLTVSGDKTIYAIYDRAKQCGSGSKGCSRLGEGQGGASLTGWTDVFKTNNPDNYGNALCALEDVGCEEWSNNDSNQKNYFKNPGSEACEYRESKQAGAIGKNWYRLPVQRCDLNDDKKITGSEMESAVCIANSDCLDNKPCIVDENEYLCEVSLDKTFGFGGANSQVPVPSSQAGLCEHQESSCTEYIDPVSQSSANLVVNPTYKTVDGRIDGWGAFSIAGWLDSTNLDAEAQFVRITPNKMYSFLYRPSDSAGSASGQVSITFLNGAKRLLASNQLGEKANSFTVSSSLQPIIFNSSYNDYVLVMGGATDKSIEIKEVIIDYQLSKNVNKQECNGLTDFSNGCILFNERRSNGVAGLTSLTGGWDPYLSNDKQAPKTCLPGSNGCLANELIKVRPDRVCAKWLDCISYIQDPYTKKKTCYAFSECDRLDDKGECANFINTNLNSGQATINQNSTGYTIPGNYNLGSMKVVGRLLEEIDEDFDDIGFICNTTEANGSDYCKVSNPKAAEKATDYPADGESYLKIITDKSFEFATTSVRSNATDEYYINYLLSTKGSRNAVGKVEIIGGGQTQTFSDKSQSGWTRKVKKFSLAPGLQNVVIRLTAEGGETFFDDVSVQPVLKTASSTYSVPECRLYPDRNSFTCLSKNKNVVTDGLSGYCLEKDPLNPEVCLMWYPMDNLPIPSISNLGYTGNFPLNYCTRLNGDFKLVEHRRAYLVKEIELSNGEHTNICGEEWYGGSDAPGHISQKDNNGVSQNNHHGCFGDMIVAGPDKGTSGFSCPTECPTGYKTWFSWKSQSNPGQNSFLKVICIPDSSAFLPNGMVLPVATRADAVYVIPGDNNWEHCNAEDSKYSTGYAVFNGFHGGEARGDDGLVGTDPQPNLRIYDNSNPPDTVAGFKEIPGTFDNDPPTTTRQPEDKEYFRFTCSQLVQAVGEDGLNAAWSGRTKSEGNYVLNVEGGSVPINYVWNMANPPFGGLIHQIVGGVTKALAFKDANSSTANFAGQPYGCLGNSCPIIGYCKNDHSMTCLLATDELSTNTCGSYGPCQPLWNGPAPSPFSEDPNFFRAVSSLKNIFLKAQKVFKLSGGSLSTYQLDTDLTPKFNFLNGQPGSPAAACSNNIRGVNEYCHILPRISNIKLYFEDRTQPLAWHNYDLVRRGIYRLEFNTNIDKEQQPMKKLIIDWGDGYTQTITNQDHAPSSNSPHVIYHYYNQLGIKNIQIRIEDNWNYFCDTRITSACHQPL